VTRDLSAVNIRTRVTHSESISMFATTPKKRFRGLFISHFSSRSQYDYYHRQRRLGKEVSFALSLSFKLFIAAKIAHVMPL
jgi:hypothetical protein